MKKEEQIETVNLKVWRYLALIFLFLSVCIAFITIPTKKDLNYVKGEISSTEAEIQSKSKVLKQTSPANQKSNFNLISAEKEAQTRIYSGITYALGGAKNHQDFEKHRKEMNAYLGKSLTDKLYRYNGEREDVISNPKDFKFDLLNKTEAQVTFKPVTDINHAKVNAVTTYFSKDDGKEKKFRSLIIFDYDLKNQKVNSSKIINFDDSNLSGNQGE